MDPVGDVPMSSLERTFWRVWYYVTEAVNRFLRPEPTNIISNEPNSADNSGPPESVTTGGGVNEEQPLGPTALESGAAVELSLIDIDLGSDEEYKTQLSVGSEDKPAEEGGSMREEYFSQAEKYATLFTPKDEEENTWQKQYADGQVESPEKDENEEHVKTVIISDNAISEGMKENQRKPICEEETQRTVTPDDPEKEDETVTEIQVNKDNKIHHLEENDNEIKVCTTTDLCEEEEENMHIKQAMFQKSDTDTELMHEEVSDCVLELSETSLEDATFHLPGVTGQEVRDDIDEEEHEEKNLIILDEEQDKEGNMNEAANIQTQNEEPEQDEDFKMFTEHILTKHITCSKELEQIAETELHTAEEEDVAQDTKVQIKTRKTDGVGAEMDQKSDADVSVNYLFLDEDQVELIDNESYMEISCTTTSVTAQPDLKSGQETIRELENIPLNMCEGQVVVSQELNSPACMETQEGVPEYNNEPKSDENTTQRFLEVGNCEEIQTTQLQEEVERRESESLQNGDCSAGADQILEKEHREEDINKDTGLSQQADKPPVERESGLLFEEVDEKLLVNSMKREIEQSDKVFETHSLADEISEMTTTEQHDVTEEVLVAFEIDEGSKDGAADIWVTAEGVAAEQEVKLTESSTLLDAIVQKMTEPRLFHESIERLNPDQNCSLTPILLEDITESGSMDESVKPEIVRDCTVELQNAVIDIEETGYKLKKEETEDKTKMGIPHLQLVEIAAEPIKETDKNINLLIAESQLDDAFEMNKNIFRDTEGADELVTIEFISAEEMTKQVTDLEGRVEETRSSISGHQDVIDEEILDLWIQAALPEATDDVTQQEGSEPGHPKDTKIETSNDKQAEITSVQTEMEKEQFVESNSGDSRLMSDMEMSSSTAESISLDQSLCEYDTQNHETGRLKSTSTESFQEIYDMLASMSETAEISELSTQQYMSESQNIMMEESADMWQLYLKDEESMINTEFHLDSTVTSSVVTHQNQESNKSQDKTHEEQVEPAQTETGSQKDNDAEKSELAQKMDWENTEEANAVVSSEKVERTKAEDKPDAVTVSDTPDEIEQFGQSTSVLEVLSEEKDMLTESGFQGITWTESENLFKLPLLEKPMARWSAELNRTEVVEQPTTQFGDLIEVDTSALDFTAQRSRIALKNPRVRPPKDARSLLHMPSAEPTPSSHLPAKVPAGVPLGGLGIGIKLPGLGAGFPVLKKSPHVVREEKTAETSQESEKKPNDRSDIPKEAEAQHKPKWMPPKHPGFGNPLMSELKTKLKKTTKE